MTRQRVRLPLDKLQTTPFPSRPRELSYVIISCGTNEPCYRYRKKPKIGKGVGFLLARRLPLHHENVTQEVLDCVSDFHQSQNASPSARLQGLPCGSYEKLHSILCRIPALLGDPRLGLDSILMLAAFPISSEL
jgi:hypothetical protein